MPDPAAAQRLLVALAAQAPPASNAPSLMERLRGKRSGNITLPSEGEVDERLPLTPEQRQKAFAAANANALLP